MFSFFSSRIWHRRLQGDWSSGVWFSSVLSCFSSSRRRHTRFDCDLEFRRVLFRSQLLQNNGVDLAFNGHAHIYERNIATPGGVTSYVTGGGGAAAEPVSSCTSTDAYALGWSYGSSKGSACGGATPAASDSQVYNFLKVTVHGTSVTVTPVNDSGGVVQPPTPHLAPGPAPPP